MLAPAAAAVAVARWMYPMYPMHPMYRIYVSYLYVSHVCILSVCILPVYTALSDWRDVLQKIGRETPADISASAGRSSKETCKVPDAKR